MDGEADAVVGDTVLREVVGADFFAAIAAADHRFALFRESFLLLLHLDFIQTGAQDAHTFLAILDLGFFVLAADHCVGGNVGDAHGRVGCVDGLAARAGRAKRIDAQVFGFDLDVDILSFGQDGDRDRGSVHAALLLGSGYALHAMDTALVFQLRVDALAFDDGDDFL